ncbi:hypothetical protein DPMN_129166 [Dreissena polymorpha]|uniref:Uncharacterized protein n=1 Tax=Dreissena polymorpha TaxID=45954 RepID=A0A9D4H0Q6_DREPO|nr:hypothetical protein DPMN_129166 [Dreissena polymorpha]
METYPGNPICCEKVDVLGLLSYLDIFGTAPVECNLSDADQTSPLSPLDTRGIVLADKPSTIYWGPLPFLSCITRSTGCYDTKQKTTRRMEVKFKHMSQPATREEKDFEFAGEKAAQLSDDEDLLADQEGSGDTEGSGEAPISRETVTPVLSGKPLGVPTLYRAKVNVTSLSFTVEIQSARAERRLSSLAITLQLENAINTLLASRLRGQIRCRIVDYEPGSLIAVFDIDTDGSQSEDEIAAVLKGSLRSGLLNGYSVSPEGFQFSRVRTGTAECSATVGRQAVAQPRRAANTNAHLMVTNTFPCRGFVISWNYSSVDTSRGYIGIFREMSETEFTLVDYTAVTPGSVGPQRVVLTKPILVENGDFIGIFYDVGARGSIGMIDSDTRVSPDARPDLYSTYQLSASTSDFTNGTFRVADISTTEMLSAFAVQAEMSYANVPEPTTPAVTECTSQQYRCRSGECIPGEFRCDNQFDCADGSDEEDGCVNSGSSQECKEKEFRCRNSGQCIAQDLVCDSVDDCGDNSDEEVIDCGPGPVLITSYKDSSSPTAYTLSWTRPRGNTTVNSYTLKWRKLVASLASSSVAVEAASVLTCYVTATQTAPMILMRQQTVVLQCCVQRVLSHAHFLTIPLNVN